MSIPKYQVGDVFTYKLNQQVFIVDNIGNKSYKLRVYSKDSLSTIEGDFDTLDQYVARNTFEFRGQRPYHVSDPYLYYFGYYPPSDSDWHDDEHKEPRCHRHGHRWIDTGLIISWCKDCECDGFWNRETNEFQPKIQMARKE